MDRATLLGLMERAGMRRIKPTAEGAAAICPIHQGDRPTFNINADSGLWQCWNPSCGQTGNLVTFLVRIVKMPYPAAIEYAKHVPVLSSSDPSQWRLPAYDERWKAAAEEILPEATLGLYSKCPLYMVRRGFPKDFLKEYDIGFDEKGYEHPPGSGQMMGANRVTFPVRDPYGRLIGFTRRAVNDAWPKVLHDFDKTRTLYCLDRVPRGAVLGLAEGPVDALRCRYIAREVPGDGPLFEALRNMTATLGSFGPAQVELVSEFGPSLVVLAFDNDDAGRAATRKTIRLLRESGIGAVKVLSYPGKDPGDLTLDDHVDLDLVSTFQWLTRS